MFQAEVELFQTVEPRLKEELASLRERNSQLEFEVSETVAKLDARVDDHKSFAEEMETKLTALNVSQTLKNSIDHFELKSNSIHSSY